ncbi:hypothetical protein N7493_011244 [Penicillium malachiteum]|uniref:CHAT domain-containing protein n=1 Tax=Penicillium malachiteum TaxID=1324776 RepID=A0AAD6MR01_9EURO|nr:hypothetical protein N7493_011244 [Penicillium malachiteum]
MTRSQTRAKYLSVYLDNEIGQGLLELVQEGDRLAIWGRAQFPGWMNFIKQVGIKVQPSERLQSSPNASMSQVGRSIEQDRSTPTDQIDRSTRTLTKFFIEQATVYDRLRNEVNTTAPDLEGDDFRLMRTQKLREAVTNLEECISSIRALPGFEQFLLGPSLSELKHHATEGPIIMVNVTELRSDAIIIQESGVDSIELPQLTRTKTIKWIEQSLTTYNDPIERGKKNKRYKWLWTSCVELVLEKVLDQTEHPDQAQFPRVWWIGSTNNTISRAISSYTPTVKALIYSRERGTTITRLDEKKPKAMVVTMLHTPGKVDLPGVERGKTAIEEHSGTSFITSTFNEPSAKAVLENVKECDVLHFAGHGISDYHDPFNSSLLLTKDDGAAAVVDRLTVRDIFNLHLKQAKLAYISACSTAEVQEEKLLDEVIHLASGFQVAGFNHVIASM